MAAQRTWRESGGWRGDLASTVGIRERRGGLYGSKSQPCGKQATSCSSKFASGANILSENDGTYFLGADLPMEMPSLFWGMYSRNWKGKKGGGGERGTLGWWQPYGGHWIPPSLQLLPSNKPHLSVLPSQQEPWVAPLSDSPGRVADSMTFCNCRRSLADKHTTVFIIPRGRRLALASGNKYGHSRPGLEQTALVGKGQRQHGAAV